MGALHTREPGILEQLQTIAVGLLAQDDMVIGNQSDNGAAIPVITEDIGDLVTELDLKIAQTGICLLVRTPGFEFTNEWVSQAGAISYDGMGSLTVDVFENVTLNQALGGTKIPAKALAERLLRLIHGQPTGLPDNAYNPSHFMGMKRPFQQTNEGPPLQYSLLFQAHVTLATPSI